MPYPVYKLHLSPVISIINVDPTKQTLVYDLYNVLIDPDTKIDLDKDELFDETVWRTFDGVDLLEPVVPNMLDILTEGRPLDMAQVELFVFDRTTIYSLYYLMSRFYDKAQVLTLMQRLEPIYISISGLYRYLHIDWIVRFGSTDDILFWLTYADPPSSIHRWFSICHRLRENRIDLADAHIVLRQIYARRDNHKEFISTCFLAALQCSYDITHRSVLTTLSLFDLFTELFQENLLQCQSNCHRFIVEVFIRNYPDTSTMRLCHEVINRGFRLDRHAVIQILFRIRKYILVDELCELLRLNYQDFLGICQKIATLLHHLAILCRDIRPSIIWSDLDLRLWLSYIYPDDYDGEFNCKSRTYGVYYDSDLWQSIYAFRSCAGSMGSVATGIIEYEQYFQELYSRCYLR